MDELIEIKRQRVLLRLNTHLGSMSYCGKSFNSDYYSYSDGRFSNIRIFDELQRIYVSDFFKDEIDDIDDDLLFESIKKFVKRENYSIMYYVMFPSVTKH